MHYRKFGRLGWSVSEVGYGMWGIAGGEGGWTGADDESGMRALQHAVDLGCNFYDTAWVYGRGHSEDMLGRLLRANPDKRLYVATKVPPKDRRWPSTQTSTLPEVFPHDHVYEYVDYSLANLGVAKIDLLQFHVWEDSWAHDGRWQRVVADLKDQGAVDGIGISVNRWEPWNVLETLTTGLVDAVQVIYNIFDQAPEDELFGRCDELGVAVIARVPFDEGTLTGNLSASSSWPPQDWRSTYFCAENLIPSVERAERLKKVVPSDSTLPALALRFILDHPTVSTVIPGMRSMEHVAANCAVSNQESLAPELMAELRRHRWDRTPKWWSG